MSSGLPRRPHRPRSSPNALLHNDLYSGARFSCLAGNGSLGRDILYLLFTLVGLVFRASCTPDGPQCRVASHVDPADLDRVRMPFSTMTFIRGQDLVVSQGTAVWGETSFFEICGKKKLPNP